MANQATSIDHQIASEIIPTMGPFGRSGRLWLLGLSAVVLLGLYAYITQLRNGLQETAMRDYVSWGMYMTNFVFFIGISHAGTLISAILRVTHAEWRRPITRMAEAITVFALVVGASMVIIDMGRPDRIHHVILYGRMQSPILWDVCAITTYLSGSFLYLYVAMIPDLTIMTHIFAKQGKPKRARFYKFLSLGFRNTPEQVRRLNIALAAMAVIIIPVAISVHTVVSWIFAMTLRPGWHSTIFGPYFVVGAIYSGTAAIILAMAIFRKSYRLKKFLTDDCFHKLGTLLLALAVMYAYFTLSEYLTAWYGGLETEARLLRLLMGEGKYGHLFWLMAIVGIALPIKLLIIPAKNRLPRIVIASILVNIGMWLKRYLIVVPTMETPYIPASAAGDTISYFPSWVEWSITAGALALFIIMYMLFSKVFPILSMWEIAEPLEKKQSQSQKQARAETSTPGGGKTGSIVGVVLILCGVIAMSGSTKASAAPQDEPKKPVPQVSISRLVEDDEDYLVAEVMLNGEPVEGVEVSFGVVRTFGMMKLGSEETWDDGTAAVEFPHRLPGNSKGELKIVVSVAETDELASVTTDALILGGLIVEINNNEQIPQALWSSRPLWPLIVVVVALLTVVWTTYIYVVVMLTKIAREEVPLS